MNVAVIGASTAGLYTAYLLARAGVEATVFERNAALGPPRRTLIATRRLADVLGFFPDEAVLNEVRRIEVFSRSRSCRIELRRPDLVVEREKLVLLLGRLAARAGVNILTGHEFRGFAFPPQRGEKVFIRLRNAATGETIRRSADILIGADGHTNVVGLSLAQKEATAGAERRPKAPDDPTNGSGRRLKALSQARILLSPDNPKDTIRAWFDPGLTPYFIWLIPESGRTAVVGTIAESAPEARAALGAFLERHDFTPLEFQEAPVPGHRFRSNGNLASPSRTVFTVGDAAGQVKATTVGGLVTGLRGAASLSSALLNGRHYHRELRPLKRELDLHLLARSVLGTFDHDDYDRLLSLVNGRLSRTLSIWSRDELTGGIWRLAAAEPRLIALGLRAWLRKRFS